MSTQHLHRNPLDPHTGASILSYGAPLDSAQAAVLLLHGRGASAADILSLAAEIDLPDLAYLAPQAKGHTWYPYSFLSPMEMNEPWLSSALNLVDKIVTDLHQQGFPSSRVVIGGFSQGACLASEYIARHARRFAALLGLSGGLIGPPGTPRDYKGSLDGTPVFLGCSDVDPHIPKERVLETASVLEKLGAQVTTRLYAGMGHTVNHDELNHVRTLLKALLSSSDPH